MSAGILVRDAQSNLVASAHRSVDHLREYEFTMPLQNADLGDTAWSRHQTYMLAVLVGPTQQYSGFGSDIWMSDQILIRVGSPSTQSIYVPPYLVGGGQAPEDAHGSHQD